MTKWLEIPGQPNYEVSEYGCVRRKTPGRGARAGHQLSLSVRPDKRLSVMLYSNGKSKRFLVHRLVALAFIGPPPSSEHQAAHGDGKPYNNHFSNLRWATGAENEADKILHGTIPSGERHGGVKLSTEKVIEIRRAVGRGVPQISLAREYTVSKAIISMIANGKRWTHI